MSVAIAKEKEKTRRVRRSDVITTIPVHRDVFERLKSLKGRLTWTAFLKLLLSFYEGLVFNLESNSEVYRLIKLLDERSPLAIKFQRLKGKLDDAERAWVKKYIGHEVYSATVIKSFNSVTVWVARVGDKLVLINIKANFINPISRETYMEMLKQAILVAVRRVCGERECKGFTVDPEMPLDPEVSRELEDWFNKARERFHETLREITPVKTGDKQSKEQE